MVKTKKSIDWKATIRLNLIRSVIAGIIFGIIFIVMALTDDQFDQPLWTGLIMPLTIPICYFLILLPLGIVAGWLSRLDVPFVWMVTLIPALVIMLADPIIFVLNKINPTFINIEEYNIFEQTLILYVYS